MSDFLPGPHHCATDYLLSFKMSMSVRVAMAIASTNVRTPWECTAAPAEQVLHWMEIGRLAQVQKQPPATERTRRYWTLGLKNLDMNEYRKYSKG